MAFHERSSEEIVVRARALTGFNRLVSIYGGDPVGLLSASGIATDIGSNPESTLPLNRVAVLLLAAADILKVDDFGLQLAREQDISVLGAVAMIARYSKDVLSAIEGVARHLPYHTPGASLRLADGENPEDVWVCYDLNLDPETPCAQVMELSYAVAWNFFRLISGETGEGWLVSFRHAAVSDLAKYREHFPGEFRFGQPIDALVLPRRLLGLPINPNSADLRASTERFISYVVKRHPLDLGAQVAALIKRQLAGGGCGIERIAKQLGMHVRTLQRQLSAQSLYFEDIIDRVRRERAEEFLSQSVVPLTQVAALLGYTEQSSFNRACKRWFGTTPQVWRQRVISHPQP